MSAFRFQRPRLADWRGWLPPIALFLAMFAALVALGGDRSYFHRPGGSHDHNTAASLAIAENLSPARNFPLARRVWLNEDGGFRYDFYGRFPIGGYALLKLATAPFGNDSAAKLLAARAFSLLMFCGAAMFAYLAIARIAGNRSVAFAAVLLAFSGFYALYYADGLFIDAGADMLWVALAFHGMTVFIQEGRFRQLLVKTCAALLIGWHVYALLLPFIAIGFGGEALALVRSALSSGERAKAMRSAASALLRSRYVALAAIAILFGSALLAFNFANEYAAAARGGEEYSGITELPLVDAMLRRFGVSGEYDERPGLAWGDFLRRQFYRAGAAALPYSLVRAAGWDFPVPEPGTNVALAPALLGLAAACAAMGAIALSRRWRILTATAILFGFCWTIPLRHNTFYYEHMFEGLPYTGLALALFAFALSSARRMAVEYLGGRAAVRLSAIAAALAAAIFALSVFQAGQSGRDADRTELGKALMADLDAIAEITRGKRVAYSSYYSSKQLAWNSAPAWWHWKYMTAFLLAGSYVNTAPVCERHNADFAVSDYRHENLATLTPENRVVFLYGDPPALCREKRRRLEERQPAARAVFDVYWDGDEVGYLKAPCAPSDWEAPFFAYAYPIDPNDMAARFRRDGYDPASPIRFEERGESFDGACLMTVRLPDYPIAAFETGQYESGGGRLWDAFLTPPETAAAYEGAYREIASSSEPAARSDFDVYLNGGALHYLKEPCDESDARGRFFLSVHPADERDLPAEMRERGHESLNFTFAPPVGAFFNGKCLASRGLPDYEIVELETGQWVPGGDRLWDAAIVVGD